MTERGGRRPGAGRPKGARDKLTREQGATIAELARAHRDTALQALADIATSGASESARVAAAQALLDRGFGKAPQAVEIAAHVTTSRTIDPKLLTAEERADMRRILIAASERNQRRDSISE